MTRSSPLRRSQAFSSPERGFLSSFLGEERNSEFSHLDALTAAQVEHERVREAAIRVYQLHELKEEHDRIVEAERREQERLKAEAELAAEELRLRELKAKSVPKPPPEPEPKKEPVQPPKNPEPPKQPAVPGREVPSTKPSEPPKEHPPAPTPTTEIQTQPPQPTTQPNPPAVVPPKQPEPQKSPFALPNGTANKTAAPVAKPASASAQPSPSGRLATRYVQIHQELKKLRKILVAESKVPGSPMKGKLGSFRREIRVSIGQLTAGRGANAKPIGKITEILNEALRGQVPSPPINVGAFVTDDRPPLEGALNNGDTMPSLFIYLLNVCAKGIINQFINEGGANPKAAEPVGVFAAHIFSHKDFLWRGKSLIDILVAKLRIVCPVLFGVRGNDRTERGRTALGWKKEGPAWVTEQSHNDRMTGLGAGFASLSLRDFSKTTKSNPYPPSNYWIALADMLNTPANEISNTQYVVLRAMIDGHTQRFLNFYGNAALSALRLALIEFPKKAPATATAAGSLRALADVLRGEGLVLPQSRG